MEVSHLPKLPEGYNYIINPDGSKSILDDKGHFVNITCECFIPTTLTCKECNTCIKI